jgi:hypothetical protein
VSVNLAGLNAQPHEIAALDQVLAELGITAGDDNDGAGPRDDAAPTGGDDRDG